MSNIKFILMCFMFMILLFGCGDEEAAETKPPLVKVQQVTAADVKSEETYSGTVKGRYQTNLAFQVGGQIMSRNVDVGSFVRAGEVLMTINPRDVVQQSNQAEAQVSSSKAQLDLAASELARYKELFKANAIAASVLDQYQTNYNAASAAYENALAAAAQSQNALEYTNLIADSSGVISSIAVESGQVVSAGQTVATLVQTSELEVVVDIPENKITDIQIDMPVNVSFWALPDKVEGYVREIAPMADSAARTFTVKIAMPSPPNNMQLGMTASVSLSTGTNSSVNATILPLSAIYQTNDKPQVWIVKDGKVTLKSVVVKDFENNNVMVYGLNTNDVVVTAGVHKLRDGQSVRVE
ncbi:MAG: efflux RND transporter periplasmic adaptor subunit [Selenomonadaceae bacterium]|nr:efflux RND transporter periplasmic adaptor subunit [Selenomonadaceae bacterium]